MASEVRQVSVERYAVGLLGLFIVVLGVCVVTLTPSPVDQGQVALVKEFLAFLHSKGVPKWFGYNKLEFTANIIMFVPLGFFAGLLLPLNRVWVAGLAGTTFSVCVEVLQFFVLPERFASVLDVLANTVGGWIGIGLAVLLRLLVQVRDRRVLNRAFGQQQYEADRAAAGDLPSEDQVAGPVVAAAVVAADSDAWVVGQSETPSHAASGGAIQERPR